MWQIHILINEINIIEINHTIVKEIVTNFWRIKKSTSLPEKKEYSPNCYLRLCTSINGNEIDAEKEVQTFGVLETKYSAKVFLKLLIYIT